MSEVKPEAFDPAVVPVYPMVRVRLRAAESGESFEGLVAGEVVATADTEKSARGAVMKIVADRAARRKGSMRAVRVAATDVDGNLWHLVVTETGQVFEAGDPEAPQRSGFRWWWATLPAAVILVVASMAIALLTSSSGSDAHPQAAASRTVAAPRAPSPTPTQLPVAGPPSWSQQATWSIGLGDQGSVSGTAGLSADAARVYAASDSSVGAYTTAAGQRVWSASIDGPAAAGPAVTRVDDEPAVVAATSGRLYAWVPATGKEIGSWKLPNSGAQVSITASGPMVTTTGQHVRIVVGGKLVARVLPAGATPVGPGSAGSLVVAGAPGQVWSVGSDQVAGSPISLAGPKGTTFVGVAGWTGSQVIAAYQKSATDSTGAASVRLRAFAAGSWTPQWTTGSLPAAQSATTGPQLVGSPDGRWGVYGSSTVDLSTGTTHGLPADWQTSAIGRDVGFGTSKGRVLTITPSGLSAASSAAAHNKTDAAAAGSAQTVVAPQAASGGQGFLIASDGSSQHLYALTTDSPAATGTPTSTQKAKKSTTAKKGKGR